MNKFISVALVAACVATSGCAESAAFRHATYVGIPYSYDEAELPILQARNTDPGRHFHNEFRGRNWQ